MINSTFDTLYGAAVENERQVTVPTEQEAISLAKLYNSRLYSHTVRDLESLFLKSARNAHQEDIYPSNVEDIMSAALNNGIDNRAKFIYGLLGIHNTILETPEKKVYPKITEYDALSQKVEYIFQRLMDIINRFIETITGDSLPAGTKNPFGFENPDVTAKEAVVSAVNEAANSVIKTLKAEASARETAGGSQPHERVNNSTTALTASSALL